jgi:hypothetical protein
MESSMSLVLSLMAVLLGMGMELLKPQIWPEYFTSSKP